MVLVSPQFTQLVDFDPILTDLYYNQYTVAIEQGGDSGLGQLLDASDTRFSGITPGGVMQLFGIRQSQKAKETDLRVDGFSDPKEFTGKVQYEAPNRGYEVEYAHTEYAHGFQITRKMSDDLQYDNIFESATELGIACARKMRKDAASVFNNAFSSSFLGYDAKALCANDHPRSRTDSTSVDNNYTLALTSDNLETVITGMQGVGDSIGEEITVMPDTLVVPRALRKQALEIVGSDLQPATANNAINVHLGMNIIVDPYLTDTNAWFVVDSSMSRRMLKWYNRVLPEFAAEADFDTFIRKYRAYMRYSYGWSDFRWVAGSNPS